MDGAYRRGWSAAVEVVDLLAAQLPDTPEVRRFRRALETMREEDAAELLGPGGFLDALR